MKFNFEGLGKKIRNTAIITSFGFMAGSAMGQDTEVPTKVMGYLNRLQEVGILDKNLSKTELDTLSKDEYKLKELGEEYRKITGAKLPSEIKFDRVISRTSYGVNEKTENKTFEPKVHAKEFDFESWFAEQLTAGKEGQTIKAPNGVMYPIIVDRTKKVPITPKLKSDISNDPGDAMASADQNTKEFILLKNKKFEK